MTGGDGGGGGDSIIFALTGSVGIELPPFMSGISFGISAKGGFGGCEKRLSRAISGCIRGWNRGGTGGRTKNRLLIIIFNLEVVNNLDALDDAVADEWAAEP